MRPGNSKKKVQLNGLDPGTAANRLIRNLLWDFVRETGETCYRCGYELDRESFSIDHKTPWLDSKNPVGLFFDLDNIAYSHLSCNVADGRRPHAWTEEELAAMPENRRRAILLDRAYSKKKRRDKKK